MEMARFRDWLFAEDTVKGIDMAIRAPLEKVKGEVFNLATGRSISVLEIARIISTEFDGKSDLDYGFDRFGQSPETYRLFGKGGGHTRIQSLYKL